MKIPSLLKYIGVAMFLTCLAIINDFILRIFLNGLLSAKLNISLIIFLYLTYLIWQSHLIAGKTTLFLINLCVMCLGLLAGLHIITLALVYLVMIWLNRVLLCYSSALTILADLALCVLSGSIVCWLLYNGYGYLTGLWCLLLLQSLHCLVVDKKTLRQSQTPATDNFDYALRAAEKALLQLFA